MTELSRPANGDCKPRPDRDLVVWLDVLRPIH